MLFIALLIGHASAEWVQISQQHFRKPLRTYAPIRIPNIEDTTTPWTYHNHSIQETSWNGEENANVKHEHFITEITKAGDFDRNSVMHTNNYPRINYEPTQTTFSNRYDIKEIAQRVPNIGTVRRVQINRSSVKSPITKLKYNKDQNRDPVNLFESIDMITDLSENTTTHVYDHKTSNVNLKVPYTTEITFLTEGGDIFIDNITLYSVNKNGLTNFTPTSTSAYDLISESSDFHKNRKQGDKEIKYSNKKFENNNNVMTTGLPIHENEYVEGKMNKESKQDVENKKLLVNELEIKNVSHPINGKESNPVDQGLRTEKEVNIKANRTESDKLHTINKVINFMMVVADTISKNSRRNIDGKIRYLHELKDSILGNIEARIDAAWPEDSTSVGAGRQVRSAHAQAEPRDHIQFPSSESTLMTISFLTFAVFLIKLVLQVIQTYKNKTMMVAPLVLTTAGRAAKDWAQR